MLLKLRTLAPIDSQVAPVLNVHVLLLQDDILSVETMMCKEKIAFLVTCSDDVCWKVHVYVHHTNLHTFTVCETDR